MPTPAAAVREVLRRGLASDGFFRASDGARSREFGVLKDDSGSLARSRTRLSPA